MKIRNRSDENREKNWIDLQRAMRFNTKTNGGDYEKIISSSIAGMYDLIIGCM